MEPPVLVKGLADYAQLVSQLPIWVPRAQNEHSEERENHLVHSDDKLNGALFEMVRRLEVLERLYHFLSLRSIIAKDRSLISPPTPIVKHTNSESSLD